MAGAPPASIEEGIYSRIPASRRMLAGMILALSNFIVVLDLTIANVSVPHIAGDLGISLQQGTWIITSYAVAEAICVPLTGWLAQRFGAVQVFIMSMLGFGVFSLLCGMSISLGMLVAFRLGQGLCGAPLMPISQMLMLRVFPPEKQGMAIGLWAMTTLLGPAFGPIVGGFISDNWSWHWIFLINIPLAGLCAFVAWYVLRPVETKIVKLPIDIIGLALLIFWIGCFQIMLDIGREHDWFSDPAIVALAVCAGIGFLAFVIWELTDEHPIVDLHIFRYPGFTFSVLTLALTFGAFFSGNVVIPQWLQSSMGYTAELAGFNTAFSAFAALLTAQIVAKLMGKIDARALISGGVMWMACMSLLRTEWSTSVDFWTIATPQFLQGLSIPFFMIPLTAISLSSVAPHEVASAAGLQNFLRTMAIAISTPLSLTAWDNATRLGQNEMASHLQPEETVSLLGQLGLQKDQALGMINNIVGQEAVMLGLNHLFYLTSAAMVLSAIMIWFVPRPKVTSDIPVGH